MRTGRHIRCVLPQQRPGRRVVQRREAYFLEAGVGDRLAANGEQSDDRVGGQPPGDERQHVDRGRVQEPGVVGDDELRPVRRRIGEQLERGESDPERVGGLPFLQPERHEQAPPLERRRARRRSAAAERAAGGARRTAGAPQTARRGSSAPPSTLSRPLDDRLEQRRLADAGITPNDASAACARRRAIEHGGQERQLHIAAVESRYAVARRHHHPMTEISRVRGARHQTRAAAVTRPRRCGPSISRLSSTATPFVRSRDSLASACRLQARRRKSPMDPTRTPQRRDRAVDGSGRLCFDNAVAETFFATLTKELLLQSSAERFDTPFQQAFQWSWSRLDWRSRRTRAAGPQQRRQPTLRAARRMISVTLPGRAM